MNYEIIKTTLLEMIKEAKNLPSNELVKIPNTNIFVKKGREKEFDVNAYYYFEYIHNQKITENTDYITDIYNTLNNEVLEENNEYNLSEAYSLYHTNETNIEHLNALNKSLETVNSNYQKLSSNLDELKNRLQGEDYEIWKEKFNKITDDIKTLGNNKNLIEIAIKNIKKEVNTNFLNSIQEAMANIERNFRNTKVGTSVSYALNGESVLSSDLEEYNSLIGLLKIMNSVDENKKIISYEGVICINEDQLNDTEILFNKVSILKNLKKEEKQPQKPNDDLINNITRELRRIEESSSKAKKTKPALNGANIALKEYKEYTNLLDILKILNKANNSDLSLVNVWNTMVLTEDREQIKNLLENTTFFKSSDPDREKRAQNEQVIKELNDYLRSLEAKMNQYNGVYNIPTRQTEDGTIVLKDDLIEYNSILGMKKILEQSDRDLVNIWNIANVSLKDAANFKKYANATRYYSNNVPKITGNDQEIEEIKKRLGAMIEEAKKHPEEPKANNGYVLANDEQEYQLLEEKYRYLEEAKASDNTISVNGVEIDAKHYNSYLELISKLEAKKNMTHTSNIIEGSESKKEEKKEEEKPVGLAPIGPKEIAVIEPNIEPQKPEAPEKPVIPPNSKKVTSVRKCSKKTLAFVRENWKKIVAVGLCVGLTSVALPQLVPAMIYANSCNALALPYLSGFFNSLSTAISPLAGVSYLNGAWLTADGAIINLGASATKALASTLIAATNIGLIGGSLVTANYVLKDHDNKLQSPKEKNNILNQIKELAKSLPEKAKSLGRDLISNAKEQELSEEELTFQEIEKNVNRKIEEEDEETRRRINERANNLSNNSIPLPAKMEESKEASSIEITAETMKKMQEEALKSLEQKESSPEVDEKYARNLMNEALEYLSGNVLLTDAEAAKLTKDLEDCKRKMQDQKDIYEDLDYITTNMYTASTQNNNLSEEEMVNLIEKLEIEKSTKKDQHVIGLLENSIEELRNKLNSKELGRGL